MFGFKRLEKMMTYEDIEVFLKENPKYQLPQFTSLVESKVTGSAFTTDSHLTDSNHVTTYSYGEVEELSTLVKITIYVTYSDAYLDSLAEILMSSSKATLKEFRKFLPKVLLDKPIYIEGGFASFNKSDNAEEYTFFSSVGTYL